jgi:hypothetical protein
MKFRPGLVSGVREEIPLVFELVKLVFNQNFGGLE